VIYSPGQGRFITKDSWSGDYKNPITLVKWMYANANPVMFTDPTGNDPYWCRNDMECYTKWLLNWQESNTPSTGTNAGNTATTSTGTTAASLGLPGLTCNIPAAWINVNNSTSKSTETPSATLKNWDDLGPFTITYYVTAREDDPYYKTHGIYSNWADQMGILPGLDQTKKYNLNWAYGNDRDVPFEGQGLSRFGEYITKDWINSTSTKLVFKYGKGGKNGSPREWLTGANGDSRLQPHDWIKIKAYPNKGPFEVLDSGEQIGSAHIDIFIGDKTIEEADSYGYNTSSVSVLK
jgi:hypothetical protein